MTDRFLNQWKEQFSFAHLHAIAAQAGCIVGVRFVDMDSVDCSVERPGLNSRGVAGPVVHVQLKCTAGLHRDGTGTPSYDLDLKNYDELREVAVYVPRLLIVLEVPALQDNWIACVENEICLRHRAYWTSLRGAPASNNKHTVRVPVSNLLDSEALIRILDTMDHNGVWA